MDRFTRASQFRVLQIRCASKNKYVTGGPKIFVASKIYILCASDMIRCPHIRKGNNFDRFCDFGCLCFLLPEYPQISVHLVYLLRHISLFLISDVDLDITNEGQWKFQQMLLHFLFFEMEWMIEYVVHKNINILHFKYYSLYLGRSNERWIISN